MGSFADLQNILDHINELDGKPDAWKDQATPDQIRDVLGYLKASKSPTRYVDPDTRKTYGSATNPDNGADVYNDSGEGGQVPDSLLDAIRQEHPEYFNADKSQRRPFDFPAKHADPKPGVDGPPPQGGEKKPQKDRPPIGPGTDPPPGPGEDAGEAKKRKDAAEAELGKHHTKYGDADRDIADAILEAQNAEGKSTTALDKIKKDITDAVLNKNGSGFDLNTDKGQAAFLSYLKGKLKEVGDIVTQDGLDARSRTEYVKATQRALATGDDPSTTAQGDPAPTPGAPPAAGAGTATPAGPGVDPSLTNAGLTNGGLTDPSLSGLTDGGLTDPGLDGLDGLTGTGGTDPLSTLASALPSMLSGLPTSGLGGGGGGDPLSGLSSAASPFADLAGKIADAANGGKDPNDGSEFTDHSGKHDKHDDTDFNDDNKDGSGKDGAGKDGSGKDGAGKDGSGKDGAGKDGAGKDGAGKDGSDLQPGAQDGQGTGGAPPAAAAAGAVPAAADTTVTLPDGSSVDAQSPQAAAATKARVGGSPVDAAWQQQGVQLPPPGTAVTHPVDPSKLHAGCLGMFKDHYEWVLSPSKALVDGQVVTLSSVAARPGFMGWFDPMSQAAAHSPQAAAAPVAATAVHPPAGVPSAGVPVAAPAAS